MLTSGTALSTLHDMSKNLPFRTVSGKAVHKFTSQQLNDRVEAAKEHQGPRKKHHTWFLDETNIGSQAHVQRLRVFEEDLPNYQLLDKIKGFPGHFFGAISYHGKSELYSYGRKLDSKDYQLLIENYVIPEADKYYGGQRIEPPVCGSFVQIKMVHMYRMIQRSIFRPEPSGSGGCRAGLQI
jgi:hypothetical protein